MENKIPDTLTWTANSHVQQKRSMLWYFFFILASIGLISYAVYTGSILTGVTFAIIMLVLLVISNPKPREVVYSITKTDVKVGNLSYPYKIIKKFWINYNPPHIKVVNLETSAYLNNRVIIQLGKQDPTIVKIMLSKYLHEDIDKEDSLIETLARRLKI